MWNRTMWKRGGYAACLLYLVFCISPDRHVMSAEPNTLNGEEKSSGWRLLFDGTSLNGWTCDVPDAWVVDDGALAPKKVADLYTVDQFYNFFFQCDFKFTPRSNGGIYLRVGDPRRRSETSFEIQISDMYGKDLLTKSDSGGIYHRLAPLANAMKPAGEWNTYLILCHDNVLKIHLNGVRTAVADLNDWTIPHVNPDGTWNKFNEPLYALPRGGYIGLQCHGGSANQLWFRNIKVLPLP